mmetsp:Transcript_68296/g.216078  ORF Transcript_68296/g.216078 Transcript_68296/m.216078 type:complete len:206 (-) Transcript_68296:653-1270(-)
MWAGAGRSARNQRAATIAMGTARARRGSAYAGGSGRGWIAWSTWPSCRWGGWSPGSARRSPRWRTRPWRPGSSRMTWNWRSTPSRIRSIRRCSAGPRRASPRGSRSWRSSCRSSRETTIGRSSRHARWCRARSNSYTAGTRVTRPRARAGRWGRGTKRSIRCNASGRGRTRWARRSTATPWCYGLTTRRRRDSSSGWGRARPIAS